VTRQDEAICKEAEKMYDTTKPYISEVLNIIRSTWKTPHLEVVTADGHTPFLAKKFTHPDGIPHMDGIGTKGVYYWRSQAYEAAAWDAFVQNINDVPYEVPYALTAHIMLPADDRAAILGITHGLADACRAHDVAYVGGETAIHDTMEGLEIGVTLLSFVPELRRNTLCIGDALIGIGSNGLHASGFTLVRSRLDYHDESLKPYFTRPTPSYWSVLRMIDRIWSVHGWMHIAGGAFTRLWRIMPQNADVVIVRTHALEPQVVFHRLFNEGVSDKEMYRTFNCGVGYVVGVSRSHAEACADFIRYKGFRAAIIGEVIDGTGAVIVESKFSRRTITYGSFV